MQKIPTLFERDWENDRSRVTEQVVPGCEWVLEGEGVATRKYDGTCVMYDGEDWWARREVKAGKQAPRGFVELSTDAETGKTIGWEPISQSPFAKFHEEALFHDGDDWPWAPGTYELCGPKVQGNPEGYDGHALVHHEAAQEVLVVRNAEGIRAALEHYGWEGFVFVHPDGRMAKIKGRDFGLKR